MTDWAQLVRPSLHGLQPYHPGASVAELEEHYGREVVRLNRNEDLFGPFPGALEAAAAELPNVWMYPEESYSEFREAVAAWTRTTPDRIVPAHGTQALIGTLATLFLDPGDAVVVPRPTYGLYAQASASRGAVVHRDRKVRRQRRQRSRARGDPRERRKAVGRRAREVRPVHLCGCDQRGSGTLTAVKARERCRGRLVG